MLKKLKNRSVILTWLFLLFAFQLGCDKNSDLPKTVLAEGIVTLDGDPVDVATIVLVPSSGNFSAAGVSDATGKFSLNSFAEKKGTVPGTYKVEVTKTLVENKSDKAGEAVVNLSFGLPKKYSTITTSNLTLTIPDKDIKDLKLELTSK